MKKFFMLILFSLVCLNAFALKALVGENMMDDFGDPTNDYSIFMMADQYSDKTLYKNKTGGMAISKGIIIFVANASSYGGNIRISNISDLTEVKYKVDNNEVIYLPEESYENWYFMSTIYDESIFIIYHKDILTKLIDDIRNCEKFQFIIKGTFNEMFKYVFEFSEEERLKFNQMLDNVFGD